MFQAAGRETECTASAGLFNPFIRLRVISRSLKSTMMRTLIIKLFTLLILIIISSCSTRKMNRQKSASSASMQSEMRMQELQKDQLETKRKLLLTDTTHEQYTLTIFPLDSFSFSRENGFRGRAGRIELSGQLRRVLSRTDSAELRIEKQRGRIYEEQELIEKSAFSKTRVLESKSWRALWFFIGLLGVVVLGWWLRFR